MLPEISVLVPVYNAADWLPRCLSSLSGQTFADFEIVAVDDGSSDASASVLKEFSLREKRLRVICQKNAGVAAARNRLLREARGKYIAFVDADDWVRPEYLSVLHTAAQKQGADVVRCLFEEYNEQTGTRTACDKRYRDYAARRTPPVSWAQRFQAGRDESQVWGKLIRSDLIRTAQLGFCRGSVAEDVSFEVLLYMQMQKAVFLPDYLYVYRVGTDTSVTADRKAMARGILLNLGFLSQELARRGFDLPEVYGPLLRLMIKGLRRFRRLEEQPEDVLLFEKTIRLIEKHRARCYCLARWRYGLFTRLARGRKRGTVIFWTKLLR